jgi:Actinobacteria/chloroflexi VLRF1 release factor
MPRLLPRSPVAQLAEHPAVNRRVVGSSPTRGVNEKPRIDGAFAVSGNRRGVGWSGTRSSWTSIAAYGLCVGQTRYIGRANLEKRLARLEGAAGRTCYRDGSARLELGGGTLTVTPPFGLGHEGEYAQVAVGPVLEALGEDHTVAALLVRLGGYAVGVFEGERLADSKVGSRFVKGRHRAGGSSANRFRRRREGQERELIEEAAGEAARLLAPWRGTVERVALGGDRAAIRRVLAARPDLAWLEPLALERFFTVPEPRQRVLDELPYQLYAAKVVSTSATPSTE